MTEKINAYPFSKARILLTTAFLATNITYFTMAPRVLHIFSLIEPGGILIFPFTFFFSDILTEVYGYKYSRFLIWCVLFLLGFFTLATWVSMYIPTTLVHYGYKQVFLNYPRLFVGVSIATFVSFFLNNSILAKLKIRMQGKKFWIRSILSTSVGHASFSAIWVLIFHWYDIDSLYLVKLILCMYLWKMTFEIIATPLAVLTSSWLKRKEGIDVYDYNTNFNPFIL